MDMFEHREGGSGTFDCYPSGSGHERIAAAIDPALTIITIRSRFTFEEEGCALDGEFILGDGRTTITERRGPCDGCATAGDIRHLNALRRTRNREEVRIGSPVCAAVAFTVGAEVACVWIAVGGTALGDELEEVLPAS